VGGAERMKGEITPTFAGIRRKSKRRLSPMTRANRFWGYLFVAPFLIGLLIFDLWPIFHSFYLSFTDWGSFGSAEWTGLDNFRRMLHDTEVWGAFQNVFVYVGIYVPASVVLSVIVAVLLNQKIRGVTLYRALFFLPVITMPAAVSIVWKWLYNADYGLINYILSQFSIQGPRWLTDPQIALYSLIAVAVWSSIGYNMIIFLSGLQGISSAYYEAASIDGAGAFHKFTHITLPLLTPTLFFVTVISLIHAFQVFDLIYVMIGSDIQTHNPVIEETQSVVFLFFQHAFVLNDKGYASAIMLLLFVLILLVTAVQLAIQKRWVHYE
jgi:multiple sugar transport system permease protein